MISRVSWQFITIGSISVWIIRIGAGFLHRNISVKSWSWLLNPGCLWDNSVGVCVYVYIYIYICVCVCVCARTRVMYACMCVSETMFPIQLFNQLIELLETLYQRYTLHYTSTRLLYSVCVRERERVCVFPIQLFNQLIAILEILYEHCILLYTSTRL